MFEYRHVVGFEDTNLVGNVYYANHLRWQGRCREMFLRQHCPEILEELRNDLALITTKCSCQNFMELAPFDEVSIRMRLGEIVQNRVLMLFDYVRTGPDGGELVARGEQEIACMRRQDVGTTTATAVPRGLREALEPFG